MSEPGLLDRRWPWLLAAALILVAFLSTFVELRVLEDPDRRPPGSAEDVARFAERPDTNVLFILIDTLRADRLGSYGYERDTSPRLDALAATGVRFARHLAQSSWTKCSMASLWTGMNPVRAGVLRFDDAVPDAAHVPAEIFRDAGFQTVGIYRNGWVAPNFGFDQGFDVYVRPAPLPPRPDVRKENPTVKQRGTDEDIVAAALEFLRANGDERWFLYLHLMDVHEYLYDEESALFGGTYSDIYDNSIRWTDRVIGVLMDHLSDRGLSERTLVVIASDHGEAFRERGFEGHARKVYKESTEVPFLIVFPFRLEPGVVVERRSRNVDIWPTVLDLVGLEPPPGQDGRSLLPALLAAARGAPPPADSRHGIAHLDQTWGQRNKKPMPTVAVTEGPLRYVRIDQPAGSVEQLFDADEDPRELRDHFETNVEALERLRGVADAYLASEPAWGEAPTRELDEFELNQLRALGYALP